MMEIEIKTYSVYYEGKYIATYRGYTELSNAFGLKNQNISYMVRKKGPIKQGEFKGYEIRKNTYLVNLDKEIVVKMNSN